MKASKHFLNPWGAVYVYLWCFVTVNIQTFWMYCLFVASSFSLEIKLTL